MNVAKATYYEKGLYENVEDMFEKRLFEKRLQMVVVGFDLSFFFLFSSDLI